MIIYILKHTNPDFSGTLCGVGFSNGRGSTSSKFDSDRCVKRGCKDITKKVMSILIAQKEKEDAKAARAKKAEEGAKKEPDKKVDKKEKEEIPEESASKPTLEEKDEEPEKEKK